MLKSNFFDNDVLKYLQSEPNGYEKIILYFKLIFKAINKEGYLLKKKSRIKKDSIYNKRII